MMSTQELDLVAIGNAIVDILAKAEDDFLVQNKISKGTMNLIEAEEAETLYSKMGTAVEVSGGAAANTVATMAQMGSNVGYIGKVAKDQLGDVFKHDIQASGVHYVTPPLEDGPPTARSLILITPDAERTMNTYLGASVWLDPEDLNQELIAAAKVTYLEGYLFDRNRAKMAFFKAAKIAHDAGRKVSLHLSDRLCVERHRDEFLDLVENHVDIIFGNEAEIKALYQVDSFEEAIAQMRGHCELGFFTKGVDGSVVIDRENLYEVKAELAEQVEDTTGAGDAYAAGAMYGYCNGLDLPLCGRIGSVIASEVVSHIGARAQSDLKKLLSDKFGPDIAPKAA